MAESREHWKNEEEEEEEEDEVDETVMPNLFATRPLSNICRASFIKKMPSCLQLMSAKLCWLYLSPLTTRKMKHIAPRWQL
jgi:hypothetical protein